MQIVESTHYEILFKLSGLDFLAFFVIIKGHVLMIPNSSLIVHWTDCIIDKIFKNIEIVKFITMALKGILNLVKLQTLTVKCCKMRKI